MLASWTQPAVLKGLALLYSIHRQWFFVILLLIHLTHFIYNCRSLSPLLNNPRMDRHIKAVVRETLPEFTSREKGMRMNFLITGSSFICLDFRNKKTGKYWDVICILDVLNQPNH